MTKTGILESVSMLQTFLVIFLDPGAGEEGWMDILFIDAQP